jgi:hypothetical protein
MNLRFRDQMLTAAKADLEPHRLRRRIEQLRDSGGGRRCDVERKMRQQVLDEIGLVGAQFVALAAAEERAARMRRGIVAGWHVAGSGIARGRRHRSVW